MRLQFFAAVLLASTLAVVIGAALALPARAQQPMPAYDPVAVADGVRQLLSRTPDREIDGLFHALHGAMREPREAGAICSLFDDGAERGFEGLNRVAMQLGEASRQRFVDAIAYAFIAGLEGQSQAYDRAAAEQALKSNGARAAMLHDGFTSGFAEGASRDARCASLGQMLDILAQRPQSERVLVTRLLLEQGLHQAVRPMAARGR